MNNFNLGKFVYDGNVYVNSEQHIDIYQSRDSDDDFVEIIDIDNNGTYVVQFYKRCELVKTIICNLKDHDYELNSIEKELNELIKKVYEV